MYVCMYVCMYVYIYIYIYIYILDSRLGETMQANRSRSFDASCVDRLIVGAVVGGQMKPGRYGQSDAARAMRPRRCGQGDVAKVMWPR